jgi:hypothetical protein
MSTDTITIKEYTLLKSFIESNSTKNDKIFIWKIMSLHYAYLERIPASLPYINFDNFIYLTPMGGKIELDLIKRFNNSPPKLVISDEKGQGKFGFGELGNPKSTKNSFPIIERFINDNYIKIWESPNRNFLVFEYVD